MGIAHSSVTQLTCTWRQDQYCQDCQVPWDIPFLTLITQALAVLHFKWTAVLCFMWPSDSHLASWSRVPGNIITSYVWGCFIFVMAPFAGGTTYLPQSEQSVPISFGGDFQNECFACFSLSITFRKLFHLYFHYVYNLSPLSCIPFFQSYHHKHFLAHLLLAFSGEIMSRGKT